MELRQIRYFLTLAETLNFTEASELIGITQPALSKAVQRMEEEFGGPLIYRDGKNTRLTDLGKSIRKEMQRISESEERAKIVAYRHLNEGYAEIKVGIANSLGPEKFTNFLMEFKKKNPNVKMTLHPVSQENAYDLILSGALDCCFCASMGRENHKIKATSLFTERLMIAVSSEHSLARQELITWDDLTEEPYFDRVNCEFRVSFCELLEARGLDLNIAMQSDREDWIQHFVAGGHGICSLPEHSIVAPNIVLKPVNDIDLSREIYFVSVFGSANSNAFRKLDKFSETHSW